MTKVVMYTTQNCPYCHMAKTLLAKYNVAPEEIRIDEDPSKREEMLRLTNNKRTVPQIFINDQLVGGFDDLSALAASGKLDSLLQSH